MRISVIVPCYNCSATLEEAYKSLADQQGASLEIILIDDGSSDATSTLIEAIAARDSRVVPIYNDANRGVSAARNQGIDAASGTFIFFMDADDILRSDCLQILADAVTSEEVDLVRAKHHWWVPETDEMTANPEEEWNFVEVRDIRPCAYPQIVNMFSSWNALIRAACLIEHGIRFPEDMRLGEDRHFNMRVFEVARRITLLNDYTYCWRKGVSHTQQATKVLVGDATFTMTNALAFFRLSERPWFIANSRHRLYLRTIVLVEVVSRLASFGRQIDARTLPDAAKDAINSIFLGMSPADVQLTLPGIKGRSAPYAPLYAMAAARLGHALTEEFYTNFLTTLGRIRIGLARETGGKLPALDPAREIVSGAVRAAVSRRTQADLDHELKVLRRSGLVDPSYYRTQHPDVAEAKLDEVLHYQRHGFAELRNPNDWFDTCSYLKKYPELLVSGTNPLLHYALRSSVLLEAKQPQ